MKKALVFLMAVCLLCALSVSALADNWDFLHAMIRISSADELEALAAEHGISMEGWGSVGDYGIHDFTLEGIPVYDGNAYRFASEPTYVGMFSFQAPEGSEFLILSAALIARYGQPHDGDETTLEWEFEDARIYCAWSDATPPIIRLDYYGSGYMGNPKFPFQPTGATASSNEVTISEEVTTTSAPVPPVEFSGEAFSFRNGITAGMTEAEVIAAEGRNPDAQETGLLIYSNESAAGFSAELIYEFEGGKLAAAIYKFDTKHSLDNANIAEYEQVNAGLIAKYGPASTEEDLWKSGVFKDNPAAQAMAITIGHSTFFSSWVVQDVGIAHALVGVDNQINHTLAYTFTVQQDTGPDTSGL
ncbi:MAG: hypothetical protein FWD25_03520 [Clostridia bacterium]|nr:hypothetical protein [Clostridia bacterium]